MPDQNTPQSNPQAPQPGFVQAPGPEQQQGQTELPPLQPAVQPQLSQPSATDAQRPRRAGRGTRVRLIILAVVTGLCLLLVAIFFFVRDDTPGPVPTIERSPVTPGVTEESLVAPITPEDTGTEEQIDDPIRDSDGDGLLDSEEESAGTNVDAIDSDGDGLNDRQELRVYQTDPNNPDTDSDGFPDGDEVRNFYDPNGPGKILDESQLIEELNQTP